ncbi:MAG: riboflavin synthase [Acidobacteriota bacterium]|nr:riboflavin synthase [Acidobacteriota bacterium]MDW3229547.1 riboflavin synthase [Acidobacteriota bacterium]
MFTGLISHRGQFTGYRKNQTELLIEVPLPLADRLATGDSLAVDGVCLTLTRKEKNCLFFNLSKETLKMTTLSELKPGKRLNLELPLTINSLVGGHLVTGHVDGCGQVIDIRSTTPGKRLRIRLSRELRKLLVEKGSVAVNGVSLTVASLGSDYFEVELIPLTLSQTNLNDLRPGNKVNLECDIIGKYVYNFISRRRS